MKRGEPVVFWNRAAGKLEEELIFAEGFVRWVYETTLGRLFSKVAFAKPYFSQIYGSLHSTRRSKAKIAPFIERYRIPIHDFESVDYRNFNDFFVRKYRSGLRVFTDTPGELPAIAEGRYFGFSKIREDQKFPIKGSALSAKEILQDAALARQFEGGPLFVARLCPTDYHRFHFPDSGRVVKEYRVSGKFHSVNPLAIAFRNEILCTNERHVTILQTTNFGVLAFVEVGAMGVGKIVQTYDPAKPFSRGDEKGYFMFGGSTVILMGEPGKWQPDSDILEQTRNGRETLLRLGERSASIS